MALVVKDRVKVVTTSTGTGPIALGSAEPGYQSFSVIGDGNQTYYVIAGETQWETGVGTYTLSTNTLTRNQVFESSSGSTFVDFSAGNKNVFVSYPAAVSVDQSTPQTLTDKTLEDPLVVLDGSQGTAGQALVSQGSGQPPTWGSAGVSVEELQNTSFAYALIVGS